MNNNQMFQRDLTNMGDLLSSEVLAYQKAKMYFCQMQDQQAKQLLQDVMNDRKKNFETLNEYLSCH